MLGRNHDPLKGLAAASAQIYMNFEAKPIKPPWLWPWLLRYIFSAISPACWTADCLLAPEATLPWEDCWSKSYVFIVSQSRARYQAEEDLLIEESKIELCLPCQPRP
jgi:hypothetical protein